MLYSTQMSREISKPNYNLEQLNQLKAGFQLLKKFSVPQLLQEISQQNSQKQPEIVTTITDKKNPQATYELRVKNQQIKRKGLIRIRSISDLDTSLTESIGKIIISSNGSDIHFQCINFYSSELANQSPVITTFNPNEMSPDEFQQKIQITLDRIKTETKEKGENYVSQITSLRASLYEKCEEIRRSRPVPSSWLDDFN
jgi:hypothetical protein